MNTTVLRMNKKISLLIGVQWVDSNVKLIYFASRKTHKITGLDISMSKVDKSYCLFPFKLVSIRDCALDNSHEWFFKWFLDVILWESSDLAPTSTHEICLKSIPFSYGTTKFFFCGNGIWSSDWDLTGEYEQPTRSLAQSLSQWCDGDSKKTHN